MAVAAYSSADESLGGSLQAFEVFDIVEIAPWDHHFYNVTGTTRKERNGSIFSPLGVGKRHLSLTSVLKIRKL